MALGGIPIKSDALRVGQRGVKLYYFSVIRYDKVVEEKSEVVVKSGDRG